jgi:hypothetical protein
MSYIYQNFVIYLWFIYLFKKNNFVNFMLKYEWQIKVDLFLYDELYVFMHSSLFGNVLVEQI